MTVDERNRLRKVLLEDKEVVRQPECAKRRDPSIEVLSENEVRVGLIVNGMTHSSELWQVCELLQFSLGREIGQMRPSNDSQYHVIARGQRGEPPRLLCGALHLYDNSSSNPGRSGHFVQVVQTDITAKATHLLCHPGLTRVSIAPEVMMRVDAIVLAYGAIHLVPRRFRLRR
jgi:hypothetical protein